MSETPTPEAGWYENPEDATELRYWNGDSWTGMRRVRHPEPALPPYGAPAAADAPEQPILPGPLLAAGALLVVAGLGRALSYLAPYDQYALVLATSTLEVIGWAGAFLAFFLAGFPSRRTVPRTLALVLVGIYAVSGIVTLALALNPFVADGLFALVGLFGFATLGVGIAFGVSTQRTPWLSPRLRPLPLVLFLGLMAFGFVAGVVNASIGAGAPLPWEAGVVVAGLSGLVPIAVGVLFLVFGRSPHVTG